MRTCGRASRVEGTVGRYAIDGGQRRAWLLGLYSCAAKRCCAMRLCDLPQVQLHAARGHTASNTTLCLVACGSSTACTTRHTGPRRSRAP
jgi:hypothetical protein